MRRALPLLLLSLVVVLPVGGAHGDVRGANADARRGCGVPGNHVYNMTWGGLPRTAVLHVPRSYARRPLPLVVGLHGAGGNGPDFEEYSGLATQSDRSGFAVLFPSATGNRYWNTTRRPWNADDVGFIGALINRFQLTGCADAARVYATGVSNGGGMAAVLGCVLSDKIAAVAPVAGGYANLPACAPTRPISVLEIHGSQDRVVPYAGAPPDRLGSVPRFLSGWVSLNGCAPSPQRQTIARATVRAVWTGCRNGVRVAGIKLYGAGHEWPGGDPPGDDGPSDLDAARTVWSFFASVPATSAAIGG